MDARSLTAIARLAWWLGPWTGDEACPQAVDRRPLSVEGEPSFEAWVYRPTATVPVGALLVVPGLHHLGPADPRLDRFCRVLAGAGILVLAPFLPDFTALRVAPGLVADTARAFDALRALADRPSGLRPGVLSISFGSMPAIRLASSDTHRDQIGALVVFGGFADFGETIRFALQGKPGRPHDPLNRPVVFMNLMDRLEGAPGNPRLLMRAYRERVERTWGRPEMKRRELHEPIAREIAWSLPDELRPLFLMGCGVEPGGDALCLQALERSGDRDAWLDVRPHVAGIRCPVFLVHGRDDDVIPYEQSAVLEGIIRPHAPVRRYLTGMYAHTGQTGIREMLARLPELAGELRAMAAILRAFVQAATRPG